MIPLNSPNRPVRQELTQPLFDAATEAPERLINTLEATQLLGGGA